MGRLAPLSGLDLPYGVYELPISHRYDPQKQALYGTMEGEITNEEYRSAIEAITSSASHTPSIRSIWDLRELDFTKITPTFVRDCINIRASFPDRQMVRMAVVVAGDLGFGMTRMFEILSDDHLNNKTTVFHNFSDAEEWLLQEQPKVR